MTAHLCYKYHVHLLLKVSLIVRLGNELLSFSPPTLSVCEKADGKRGDREGGYDMQQGALAGAEPATLR